MKHEVHLEQNHGAADFRFDLAFGFHSQQGDEETALVVYARRS